MPILVEAKGTLTPKDSKQQIEYSFNVPKPMDQLIIDFKYTPKELDDKAVAKELIKEALPHFLTLEQQQNRMTDAYIEGFLPLKNLLTVSIDDPKAFRGSAHRHPNEQHLVISESASSPGFISGPIFQGDWKLVISTHAIVTQECHYSLTISGKENGDV